MNIFKKIYKVSRTIFSNIFQKKLNVMNSNETVDLIVKNKLSVGRYGDGEIGLIDGESLGFQPYYEELANKLKSLKTTEQFLVCIPDVFNKSTFNRKLLTRNEYCSWVKYKLLNGYLWKKYFLNNTMLGDAFISRFYMRYKNPLVGEYINKIKTIWQDRDIVFVEGSQSRLGYKNDLFDNSRSIRRILCPSKDAFSKYNEIISCVKDNIEHGALIILAIGPTATVMAYDLSKLGYQALDLGHIDIEYEWFLQRAKEKVAIKHKYVNETIDGRCPDDVDDVEYNNQIIFNFDMVKK